MKEGSCAGSSATSKDHGAIAVELLYLARPAKGTEAEVEERQTNCGQNSLRVQFSRTGDANKMQNGREKVP